MTRHLFFEWLSSFDFYVGQTPDRRASLLIDNCGGNSHEEILPDLLHVCLLFLPKNTTSKLQPLDAGIIAAIKKEYGRRRIHRAVDLIDSGLAVKLYDSDVCDVTQNITDIWQKLESSRIRKCWIKTGLIDDE